MITQIINGINLNNKLNRTSVYISYNKFNYSLCKYLFFNGFLTNYKHNIIKKTINLHFTTGITYIKQISKPSRKIYISYKKLEKLYKHNKHLFILSTSKGIMNSKEAIINRVGGILLFLILC